MGSDARGGRRRGGRENWSWYVKQKKLIKKDAALVQLRKRQNSICLNSTKKVCGV